MYILSNLYFTLYTGFLAQNDLVPGLMLCPAARCKANPDHGLQLGVVATSWTVPWTWNEGILKVFSAVYHWYIDTYHCPHNPFAIIAAAKQDKSPLKRESYKINSNHHEFRTSAEKTRWNPRTRMPTRMLNREYIYLLLICHIFQRNPLVRHPELTLL